MPVEAGALNVEDAGISVQYAADELPHQRMRSRCS
jgi:hypothetical protein